MFGSLIQYVKSILLFRSLPSGEQINVHKSFRMGSSRRLDLSKESSITIKDNVFMREFCNVVVGRNAILRIENDVFFNNYCSINCIEKIFIGEHTLFGEGVKIYDHNHQYITHPVFTVAKDKFVSSPVTIGKNCWIGSNVTILKGVTIGDNVIVGAGCLIHKSIPADHIVKMNSQVNVEPLENGNSQRKA